MTFEVIEIDGRRVARLLVEIAKITGKTRVVGDAPHIAFEMADVDGIAAALV